MKNSGSVDFKNLKINGIEVSEVRWFSQDECKTFNTPKPEKGKKFIYIVWGSSCTWFQIDSSTKLQEVVNGVKKLSDELLEQIYNNKSNVSYK